MMYFPLLLDKIRLHGRGKLGKAAAGSFGTTFLRVKIPDLIDLDEEQRS